VTTDFRIHTLYQILGGACSTHGMDINGLNRCLTEIWILFRHFFLRTEENYGKSVRVDNL